MARTSNLQEGAMQIPLKRYGLLLAAAVVLAPMVAWASSTANQLYIVRMAEDPVVAYRDGIAGLQATKPQKGQKVDPNDPKVVQYVQYLDGKHAAAVAAVGGVKVHDYRFTFNGFSARLSPAQAQALAQVSGVLAVDQDVTVHADTSTTP